MHENKVKTRLCSILGKMLVKLIDFLSRSFGQTEGFILIFLFDTLPDKYEWLFFQAVTILKVFTLGLFCQQPFLAETNGNLLNGTETRLV